jgi:hypothetical protein
MDKEIQSEKISFYLFYFHSLFFIHILLTQKRHTILLVDACACGSIAPLFIPAGAAVKTPK